MIYFTKKILKNCLILETSLNANKIYHVKRENDCTYKKKNRIFINTSAERNMWLFTFIKFFFGLL